MRSESELDDNQLNPYAPPATVSPSSDQPSSSDKPFHPNHGRLVRSKFLIAGVGLGAFAYLGFTIALLDSHGIDNKAGKLFLLNILVLAYWLYATIVPKKTMFIAGCGSIGVQTLIAGLMLYRGIGDVPTVLIINLAIATVMALLTLLCRIYQRRARERGFFNQLE